MRELYNNNNGMKNTSRFRKIENAKNMRGVKSGRQIQRECFL